MEDRLLKVQDVMKKLNVSRRTVYYWIQEGILKTVRLGGIYRFHPEDLEQLIESGRSAPPVKPKKILAVDDDILVRESIKSLLGQAGYAVTVASDGKSAIHLVSKQDFDLTLTDVRMPGMDGLETIKGMRKARQEAGKDPIPEIVLTGYEDRKAFSEAKKLGVKEFVTKPFNLDEFLDLIQEAVKS